MSKSPCEYWIWMQNSLGAGARTDEILAYFETPEQLYTAGSKEWRLSGILTEKKINALKSSTPSQTYSIIKECKQKGYRIITPDDDNYPASFRNLSDMPLVLYALGDAKVLTSAFNIGIVGTRVASDYGIQVAQKLSYQLAKAGAVIVSGGALGIDSEAHAGAMLANGQTVAFLGCGLSVNYLKENEPLRRAITRHGAVVSEYSPFTSANRATFPIRNRLISGISSGVVVIEAGIKSGSLITATKAAEQGKDVFAVPGDIVRTSFDGANHLIQNGAKPVSSANDILCEYEYTFGDLITFPPPTQKLSDIEYVDWAHKKPAVKQAQKKEKIQQTDASPKSDAPQKQPKALPDDISPNAKIVYETLLGGEIHIDDIVRQTGLKMNIVLSSLTELEFSDICELTSGKKYKLL